MPVFGRRRRGDDETLLDEQEQNAAESVPDAGATGGPFDVADADPDQPRLDLGALQVPVANGVEVRVEVQEEVVVGATLVHGRSELQVHAFAAPRSNGIWVDVRTEIAESLRETGGAAEEADGPFGPELRARVPAEGAPGQPAQLTPARFIGVDGPRWFLRGLLTGPAATDPAQARTLEDAFRGIVVVRGGEAMAPREMIPLRLPRDVMHQINEAQEAETAKPTLDMLERGPEITETR